MLTDFQGTARFEVKRPLGAGGMGAVYLALDRETKMVVALKTLLKLEARALYRFKNEFRALADIHHRNLVRLGELFCADDRWFFSMEYVEGVSFGSYVRAGSAPAAAGADTLPLGPVGADAPTGAMDQRAIITATGTPATFSESRLRAAMGQLVAGVSALHESDKIHRDLKPSNVRVTPEGRVVILDFGLVTDTEAGLQSSDGTLVGTPAYMAPEQAAVKAVGPEADWYAVGVMLYEALTGRLPFSGTAFEIVGQKQRAEAPAPRTIDPAVPADLDALCTDLLRIDPKARPSGREIRLRLGVGRRTPLGGVSALARRPTPSRSGPFVGREAELAQLGAAFEEMQDLGVPIGAIVSGASGIGKSALVRRFAESLAAERPDALVLAGRCYGRESVPYQGVDGIVDALVRYLERIDPVDAALVLPRDVGLLARVFPVLGVVPAVARAPAPRWDEPQSPQQLRQRAFVAMRELFARLADRVELVLAIDDLQWTDEDGMALLAEVLEPPGAPALLLVATVRTTAGLDAEPRASVDAARSLPVKLHRIDLGTLAFGEARELATLLLGTSAAAAPAGSAASEEIAIEADGHPLFIAELVRHSATATGPGAVDAGAPGGAARLDHALWARISRLEEATRRFLEVSCVARRPTGEELIADAAAVERAAVAECIAVLRTGSLIRTDGRSANMVEPYHDRVREAVLANLPEERLRDHHRRLAAALARAAEAGRGEPETLVHHLEAAGETGPAAEHAELAARQASGALAFDRAAELWRTAIRLGGEAADRGGARRRGLAEALANAGRGLEAADAYFAAAAAASDAAARLTDRSRAAEHLLGSGHIERALETLEEVLAEVGDRLPPTQARALASLLWHRLVLRLRGLRWTERPEAEVDQRDLLRIDVYKAVALTLGIIEFIRGADFQTRGLLLALRTGERRRVGRAIAIEAMFAGAEGLKRRRRAAALVAETRRIAEQGGADPYLTAYAENAAGVASYLQGRYAPAALELARAEELFRDRTTGTAWELNNVRVFRLWAERDLGRFAEVRRSFHEYVRDAARRGDRFAEATMRRSFNMVWLADDDPDQARRDIDRTTWASPRGDFHVQHWQELRARAELALYERCATAGRAQLQPSFDALARSYLLRVQLVRVESRWVAARLALAAAAEGGATAALLAEAETWAARLLREKAPHAACWAHLVRAGVAAQRSDVARANAELATARAIAEAERMLHCVAAARRREGELLGGDAGAALIADADRFMASEGVKRPERLVEIVAPGFGI